MPETQTWFTSDFKRIHSFIHSHVFLPFVCLFVSVFLFSTMRPGTFFFPNVLLIKTTSAGCGADLRTCFQPTAVLTSATTRHWRAAEEEEESEVIEKSIAGKERRNAKREKTNKKFKKKKAKLENGAEINRVKKSAGEEKRKMCLKPIRRRGADSIYTESWKFLYK